MGQEDTHTTRNCKRLKREVVQGTLEAAQPWDEHWDTGMKPLHPSLCKTDIIKLTSALMLHSPAIGNEDAVQG